DLFAAHVGFRLELLGAVRTGNDRFFRHVSTSLGRRRDRARLADEKRHADVLVAEHLGAVNPGLVGKVLLAVNARLDVEAVRPARLLDVGGWALEVLA